jgi:hypothetical protein
MTPAELLLKGLDAQLVRKRKHAIWRLPDGQNIVLGSTPSDYRAIANQVALIKRAAGLQPSDAPRVEAPAPRQMAYKPKVRRQPVVILMESAGPGNDMRDKLLGALRGSKTLGNAAKSSFKYVHRMERRSDGSESHYMA